MNLESRTLRLKSVSYTHLVKACGLAYRGGVTPDVVMSGGVAQNAGVVRAISKELKQQVIVAPHPQVAGALGAALYAYEDALKAMKK